MLFCQTWDGDSEENHPCVEDWARFVVVGPMRNTRDPLLFGQKKKHRKDKINQIAESDFLAEKDSTNRLRQNGFINRNSGEMFLANPARSGTSERNSGPSIPDRHFQLDWISFRVLPAARGTHSHCSSPRIIPSSFFLLDADADSNWPTQVRLAWCGFLGPVNTGRVNRFAGKFARKSFDLAGNAV